MRFFSAYTADHVRNERKTALPKINQLDKSVFELIAAGEVIERPASVIKELAENAVDAGAKHITIEIKNGGSTFMRVTDDGCGIAFEEIPTAFLRHATSKVKSARDLDSIFTLGFRGEALASVAAVARVEVLTKEHDDPIGGSFRISGSEITEHERTGCPDGTTIIIRDLFYNVPARQKFLKKDVTEGNQVQSLVDRLALAHPDIAFRFIRDNKTVRDTSGDGDYYSAIYAVFGRQFALSLIPVDFELGGISVSGYVSSPLFTRSNRALQYFYVNSRNVRSVICMTALEEGFRGSIMTGKFPACVLNITLSPGLCDVNVSPSKTEVRFASDKAVFDAVHFAVKNAILNADSGRRVTLEKKEIPKAAPDMRKPEVILSEKAEKAINAAARQENSQEAAEEERRAYEEPPRVFSLKNKPVYLHSEIKPLPIREQESAFVQRRFSMPDVRLSVEDDEKAPEEKSTVTDEIMPEVSPAPEEGGFRYIGESALKAEDTPAAELITDEPEQPRVKIIGEIFETYIICSLEDEMILIDKHAAHERIRFENKRSELRTSSQLLAESEFTALSPEQYAALEENRELLEDAGIEYILSDGCRCEITAAPSAFIGSDIRPSEMLIRAADALAGGNDNIIDEIYGDLQHSRACKSAIKAHDKNDLSELSVIVDTVMKDERIRFCPHGRPVMIKLSKYEIEKYFSRIQ